MLTTGKIVFAICFMVVFVGAMAWSYRKDSLSDKIHFKGASRTLVFIMLIFLAMFLFVKMRHYL